MTLLYRNYCIIILYINITLILLCFPQIASTALRSQSLALAWSGHFVYKERRDEGNNECHPCQACPRKRALAKSDWLQATAHRNHMVFSASQSAGSNIVSYKWNGVLRSLILVMKWLNLVVKSVMLPTVNLKEYLCYIIINCRIVIGNLYYEKLIFYRLFLYDREVRLAL